MTPTQDNLLERIETRFDEASDLAVMYVEQQARAILTEHPELEEFVCAMGAWFFTYKVGAVDHQGIEIEEGMSRIIDEEHVDFIRESDLSQFFADWDTVLGMSGCPMRFTATGPVVTDW